MTHEYTPNGTVWEALVELIDAEIGTEPRTCTRPCSASSPITFGPFGCLPGDGGTMTMNSAGTLPAYSGLPQFQFTGGAGGTTAGSGTYLSGGGGGGGGAGPGGNGGNGGTGGSHNDSGVGAAGSGLLSLIGGETPPTTTTIKDS